MQPSCKTRLHDANDNTWLNWKLVVAGYQQDEIERSWPRACALRVERQSGIAPGLDHAKTRLALRLTHFGVNAVPFWVAAHTLDQTAQS